MQEIERWRAGMSSARQQRELSNKTQEQPARADARDLPARGEALRAAGEPGRERRSLPRALERRHPGVLARGGLGARPRRGSETDAAIFLTAAFTGLRRGELLGAALARRRLRRLDDQGPRELRRRAADDAEVRQGPRGADGAGRRERARAARRAGAVHRRRRLRVRRRGRAAARRRRAQQPVPRRARRGRDYGRCGSTT